MGQEIDTTAEAVEADAMPRRHEVHTDPDCAPRPLPIPEDLSAPVGSKSAAQWAYERLILYIQEFEQQLDSEHEVVMGFAGGDIGVLMIEGLGYFEPDIVTFHGTDQNGTRTQLIQHVSQLNVMLQALPKTSQESPAKRIGFRLGADLVPAAS